MHKKKKVKNKKWNYQKFFFWILGISWVSGLLFFILDNFFVQESEFGIAKNPLQFPLLKIHGASAFLVMIIFGYFLADHVQKKWHTKKPKAKTGIAMLITVSVMIISAYLLYYLPGGLVRQIDIYIHLFAGFFLPIILFTHIANNKSK